MKKNRLKSTSNFIEKNKKELLYVGGSILVFLVSYKIYNALTSGASEGFLSVFSDKTETVISEIKVNPKKTTISSESAKKYAQQLLDACNSNSPFYGTDEELIKKVFKSLKSGDDFKLVFNGFGQKNYNGNGSPPSGIWRHLDSYSPRNLIYWLRSELSEYDGDVYTEVKERIESAGWVF